MIQLCDTRPAVELLYVGYFLRAPGSIHAYTVVGGRCWVAQSKLRVPSRGLVSGYGLVMMTRLLVSKIGQWSVIPCTEEASTVFWLKRTEISILYSTE